MSETFRTTITSTRVPGSALQIRASARRAFLAGGVAATALVAGAAGANSAPAASPDADLIGLCAEMDVLEHRIDVLFDSVTSEAAYGAADAAACVIEVDQRRLLDRICAVVPTTDAGCLAVARSLALLSPDYADVPSPQPTMDERLASMLLRGHRQLVGLRLR